MESQAVFQVETQAKNCSIESPPCGLSVGGADGERVRRHERDRLRGDLQVGGAQRVDGTAAVPRQAGQLRLHVGRSRHLDLRAHL